ncbi:MAG: transcription-repair coupling factor [bacterium]|nr:transcription-repair coupling factor [bacterium]
MPPLDRLLRYLRDYLPFTDLCERLSGEATPGLDLAGLPAGAKVFLTAGLSDALAEKPVLLLTTDEERAEALAASLGSFVGNAVHLPDWELLPYELHSPERQTSADRLEALYRLGAGFAGILVATPAALARKILPKDALLAHVFEIRPGTELPPEELARRLGVMGYRRVPLVEVSGEYARRGGLFDLYPPGAEGPVRLEYFGNIVEGLRRFDPESQRTEKGVKSVTVLPLREVVVESATVERLLSGLERGETRARLESLFAREPYFDGIEYLMGNFYPELGGPLDYLQAPPLVVFDDFGLFDAARRDFAGLARSEYENTLANPPRLTPDGLASPTAPHTLDGLGERSQKYPSSIPMPAVEPARLYDDLERLTRLECIAPPLEALPTQRYHGLLETLFTDLLDWEARGWQTVLTCETRGKVERLEEILAGESLSPPVVQCPLAGGAVMPGLGLVLVTDDELFGRVAPLTTRGRRKVTNLDTFRSLELAEGDYVIHTDHGVGRFLGLEKLEHGGEEADFAKIGFQGDAKLYVPIWNLGCLERYDAAEGQRVAVDRLGGTRWQNTKQRVKRAVASLAAELIAVHAQRDALPGHAFAPDAVWQTEIEESFPFTDTDDQRRATVEVKGDMERGRPMDRLLCGDVGFGKTEVAVRAAFKAVMDSRQVAILVPTTILAEQHLDTFRSRLSPFPVRVEMLSRFIPPARQREIAADTHRGEVDILIGTHRLLSGDVRFRELGLIIVDEEQRFGVGQKELLKQRYSQVDVLTLTATPIPRTLHLAMMGARDVSNIQTPPAGRYPIKTYIGEASDALILEAVGRELERGGQVFFIHNRVQSIDSVAAYLQERMPDVRFGVAHGQLPPRRLESVMHDFIAHDYDVLVTTTIVENGTDIPNCNTIIVNRADRFGLAQLYQLRGRVGRGKHRAYAYLFTPPRRVIGELAYRRLAAVAEFNELGSGYRLALKDLELRGAGDVLGPQQSGFIEQVGFDLYVRLLREAVAELRGEAAEVREPQTQVTGDFSAYLPDGYVGSPELKLRLYRRLAECRTLDRAGELKEEFADRFGPLPREVENLFAALEVKLLGDAAGVKEVRTSGRKISLTFDDFSRAGRVNLTGCAAVSDIRPRIGAHGLGLLEAWAVDDPLRAAGELVALLKKSLADG